MIYYRLPIACCCLVALIFISGCGKKVWQAPWTAPLPSTPSEHSNALFDAAMDEYNKADSRATLLAAINAFEKVLESDPGSKPALTELSNLYILLGTAYTQDSDEKRRHFQKGMAYSELAMYTNPDFRLAVESGKKPWEAADTLQAEDAPAMLFWVTALQYEFKEVMSLPGKIANVSWMKHGILFLDRIKAVAPEFGHGAVEFAYTICYCALPASQGGDPLKCRSFMDESVSMGQGYLLPRWGRGKYYYQMSGDMETSVNDLEWVAAQDIAAYKDAYPWRVHFIDDAGKQLAQLKSR